MNQGCASKTFCEFFAGIGLVHEALRKTGWECIYANDIEPKKREMYEGNFGKAAYYHVEDVWNTRQVIDRISATPFLATASFPCIDLSLAGHWKGFAGDHSSTYFGFLKVLESMGAARPRVVMLENVNGFLTSHSGGDFKRAVTELARLGYWIDAIVLDAKWFVPQSRPRTFVFGFHDSMRESLIRRQQQEFSLIPDPWTAAVQKTLPLRPRVVLEAMENVHLPTGWATIPFSRPRQIKYALGDIIDLDEKQEWWCAEETLKHYVMMEAPSKKRVDDLIAVKASEVGTAFRRTRKNKTRTEVRFDIAGCLRTPKGGSARQIVVVVIRGKLRMRWMSAVEYGRLQGASNFSIQVPPIQAMYGFGDAVCVPAVAWIDRNILTPAYHIASLAQAAA